jgi:hypothetical protein
VPRLTVDQLAGITLVAALSGSQGRRWLRNYGTTRTFRVCPVCDAANTVRGKRIWTDDAARANAQVLGMPTHVVGAIMEASDKVGGPIRRALFAALRLAGGDDGLDASVVIF